LNTRLRLEPDEDLEAEQQLTVHADDVTRRAVVLGAQALGRDQRELAAAEQRLALLVELLGSAGKLRRSLQQAPANHLVAATLHGPLVLLRRHPQTVSGRARCPSQN
jgi:hypothetical protein